MRCAYGDDGHVSASDGFSVVHISERRVRGEWEENYFRILRTGQDYLKEERDGVKRVRC